MIVLPVSLALFLKFFQAPACASETTATLETAVTATGTANAILIDIAAAVKVEIILRLIVLRL